MASRTRPTPGPRAGAAAIPAEGPDPGATPCHAAPRDTTRRPPPGSSPSASRTGSAASRPPPSTPSSSPARGAGRPWGPRPAAWPRPRPPGSWASAPRDLRAHAELADQIVALIDRQAALTRRLCAKAGLDASYSLEARSPGVILERVNGEGRHFARTFAAKVDEAECRVLAATNAGQALLQARADLAGADDAATILSFPRAARETIREEVEKAGSGGALPGIVQAVMG